MAQLPAPPSPGAGATPDDVVAWVREHLGDLAREGADGVRPGVVRGGQVAADVALAGLDVAGYARSRSTVLPESRRGATRMSPYVRHGLLTLPELWDAVADAPARDAGRYRDELLWQEYARHLYARLGPDLGRSVRREQPRTPQPWQEPLRRDMACSDYLVTSLTEDGWLVNQTRMWLASQWSVRAGGDWRAGEDAMFAHLLDGSRAANRLGWQWTIGTGSGKAYGFSRWQVEKRAPELCRGCALREACPIDGWPDAAVGPSVVGGPDLGKGPVPGGPDAVEGDGGEVVWLTAESLGTGDPALAADPDRPAVFVFDEGLLRELRLSGKRLVFLAECLGDLAAERPLEVRRGDVVAELGSRRLAATYAPVPGWARLSAGLDVVETHPWPWLVPPLSRPVRSFSAWRRTTGL
ncbi:FAD-binding domain-containing protein [Nocardioides sp.]|uniref:FAD-binding domain-containing protein n=1 Tax=Nocardioides sp. TaxID=35761 RepID=UPI0027207DFF|nr:FAD-binding domain-containing protein [Nocardioides sp.]MDO9457541.1 FAD-binding domain-containing protein [Nocardioides sp.]